eukprot:COSAG02_NODE_656_length_18809_cov_17.805077_9_plen_79_part_00
MLLHALERNVDEIRMDVDRLRSTQTSTPHRILRVGGAHLKPHNGARRVRRRALPKAGRETVKRFGVSQTLANLADPHG